MLILPYHTIQEGFTWTLVKVLGRGAHVVFQTLIEIPSLVSQQENQPVAAVVVLWILGTFI